MGRALTCMMVVALLAALAFAADPTPAKIDFEPSKVTVSLKDAKTADILKVLAEKSGNAPLALPDQWQDKTVTLELKDTPYFQALDALCGLAGLTYELKDQAVSLVEVPGASDVGVYVGPATVKMSQIAKNHSFRDVSDPQSMSLWLTLYGFWEDRLPVVADSCQITGASTADGRPIEVRNRARLPAFLPIGPWTADKTRPSARQVFGRLQNLPDKMGKTIQLEGTLRLEEGTGEKVVTIPNVLAEGNRSAAEGDVSVKVTQVMSGGGFGVLAPIPMNAPRPQQQPQQKQQPVTFSVEVRKNSKDVVAMGVGAPYGIVLADPNGKRYPPKSLTGSQQNKDGTWVATVWVSFEKPDGMNDEWSLLYVYPQTQESKEWPFRIKDVPLP